MKQLEYTMNNLYGLVKPYGKFEADELCFVVEEDYDYINELSYVTDELNDALSKAKENDYEIFVYEKRLAKDCLNTNKIFEAMLENLEEEGLDIGYVIAGDEENAEKDFTEFVEKWFNKYVGTYWFSDRFLGRLKIEEK